MKIELNQTYKQKKTFEQYPHIKKTFDELNEFTIKNNFVKYGLNGERILRGRRYDDAIILNSNIDFKDKIVCDLGARDGIFGSYLTRYVKKIYVSDYFEQWGKGTDFDLGQIDYWTNIWENAAFDKNKMIIECQDMTSLTYPDNFFDIVISTSVIEHIHNQKNWEGDIIAMKEMSRICKPGGIIALSTDMAKKTKWVSGTLYYSKEDLFNRLINNSNAHLRGEYNFDIDDQNNDAVTEHNDLKPVSPVVFTLQKN